MPLIIELRNLDPVDIFLLEYEGKLVALVLNSTGGYINRFDYEVQSGLSLRCTKHTFDHLDLSLLIKEDLALIDGCCCYHEELGEKQRRLFDVLCSH